VSTSASSPIALDLGAALEAMVRRVVRDELAAARTQDDGMVALHEALGCSRREAAERARAGEFKGAVKVGKTWRISRADFTRAITAICAPPEVPVAPPANDAQPGDATLRAIGLK
jgi:hypothetical protein